ncbi:MAG: NAD(P)/FAD-dependent oxidoreductase [archaeon]
MTDCYVTIIGGGVIGNAVAYQLSEDIPDEPICLVERNKSFPGENQTSRNSGVIHAGIYYDKEVTPLKVELCVEGNELLYQFCRTHNIPAKRTGKLIIATKKEEDKTLETLLQRAEENNVEAVEVDRRDVNEIEPNIKVYSALYVPKSGIIDPTSLVRRLQHLSNINNLYLKGTEVIDITPTRKEFIIAVKNLSGEYKFTTRYIVNAAGLDSDKIALMVNPEFPLRIFQVRGESAKYYPTNNTRVSRLVYPTPTTISKPDGTNQLTVGVHLTPTFGKEITVGPYNEGGHTDLSSDLKPTSFFLEQIVGFFPGIKEDRLHLHQAGMQAVLANGQDFHIATDTKYHRMINLVGICSPGLTSSLAIAKRVSRFIGIGISCR